MNNNSNNHFNRKGYYIYKIKNQSPLKKAKDILNNSNHSLIKSSLSFDKMSLALQKKLYNKKIHIKINTNFKENILIIFKLFITIKKKNPA